MGLDAESYFNGDRKELFSLHKKLIDIESISGNEKPVGIFLKEYLENLGYTVEWQPVPEKKGRDRANLYAYKGSGRNTRILLTSHIDTVPPFFGYEVKDGKIYGRGSVDDKNCVAAMVVAHQELLAENKIKESDVGLLFVVEEEVGGPGMKFADEHLGISSWETVIFGEPTEMKLCVGHKGLVLFQFVAEGKAAHSGYPDLGVNATSILVDALYKLTHADLPKSDLLGESTVNIGLIEGGIAPNVIPKNAQATIIIRVAKDSQKIVDIVKKIAAESQPAGSLRIEELHAIDEQLLEYEVPGFENIAVAYSTDVPYLKGDFTRYLYGSGSIHVAHSDHEYVPIDELYDSVDGYKKLVLYSLEKK